MYKLPGLYKHAIKSLSGIVDKIVYEIVYYRKCNEEDNLTIIRDNKLKFVRCDKSNFLL